MSDPNPSKVLEKAIPTATTLKQSLDVMAITVQIGHVPCLWGLSGIGKTISVRSYAEWLEHAFEAILGSIMEPPDIIGYPVAGGEFLKRLPEEWVHRVKLLSKIFVLFDDLTTLYPSMQSAMLRTIHEKRVGDIDLSHAKMIAAANPPHLAPNGRPFSAALANRMTHIDVIVTGPEWAQMRRVGFNYLITPPRINKNWVDQKPWAEALVTSYVERNSTAIHDMPEDVVNQGRAWASPRTWDYVIDHLAACRSANVPSETRDVCIASCIGKGAIPFIQYMNNQDLIDPEELLKAGYNAKLPKRADSEFIALNSLITALQHNHTAERHKQALRVLSVADLGVAATHARTIRGMKAPDGLDIINDTELADLYAKYGAVA